MYWLIPSKFCVVVVGVGWGWVSRGGGGCPLSIALPFKNINKYVSMRGKNNSSKSTARKMTNMVGLCVRKNTKLTLGFPESTLTHMGRHWSCSCMRESSSITTAMKRIAAGLLSLVREPRCEWLVPVGFIFPGFSFVKSLAPGFFPPGLRDFTQTWRRFFLSFR